MRMAATKMMMAAKASHDQYLNKGDGLITISAGFLCFLRDFGGIGDLGFGIFLIGYSLLDARLYRKEELLSN